MEVSEAILRRRTVKKFTGAGLGREAIERLLEGAVWVPNHKLTEPWRFYVVEQAGLGRLVDALRASVRPDDHDKVRRKLGDLEVRIPKLGAFITVGQVADPDPERYREDYAACCCAAYAILLQATEMGWGSYWSTGHLFDRPPVREMLGMAAGVERVASIWVGEAVEVGESRRTPAGAFTTWVGGERG